MKTIAPLLALLALGACELHLEGATAPPPGATAVLDNRDNIITLSRGVALGVDCRGPEDCAGMDLEVEDPEIADAYVSFATELDYHFDGPRTRGSLVVVGKAAGTTTLHVDADGGSVSYEVRVRE